MNDEKIPFVNGFIYLGLPIGSNGYIDSYIEEGFKKMQRSVFSLYSLGIKPKLVSPQTVAFVFKQYCQSTSRYYLDNLKIPCKKIDDRQSTLLKNAIGLNKYARTTPLLKCLKVESVKQLYQKRKVLFITQIERNQVFNYIFTYLGKKYERTTKELYRICIVFLPMNKKRKEIDRKNLKKAFCLPKNNKDSLNLHF
jgi:hypothetical protein